MAITRGNIRGLNGMKIEGEDVIALKFQLIKNRVNNVSPEAWAEVGNYIASIAAEQFLTEGTRLGRKWRPLKPSTLKYKAFHGYPLDTLIRTTVMSEGFMDRPMDLERYGRTSAAFGSGSQVAVWMHRGTRKNGKIHVPSRPILYVTEELAQEVADILANYIVEG